MPAKNPRLGKFEDQLAELESLVRDLESGDLKLEDALKSFEKGMQLSKQCGQMLREAELKIEQLCQDGDSEVLQDARDLSSKDES